MTMPVTICGNTKGQVLQKVKLTYSTINIVLLYCELQHVCLMMCECQSHWLFPNISCTMCGYTNKKIMKFFNFKEVTDADMCFFIANIINSF